MDELHIVIYRPLPGGRWRGISEGEFPKRQLAENFIECKRATGWSAAGFDFAIVSGPITNPAEMAAAEAKLGVF